MTSEKPRRSSVPPRTSTQSDVRPAIGGNERRRADRWHSNAEVEILSPIQEVALAVDVGQTGIRLSLEHWLSAGTVCDLRITTHSGRTMHKRVRVIWTRREGERCVSGLEIVGSLSPHALDQD